MTPLGEKPLSEKPEPGKRVFFLSLLLMAWALPIPGNCKASGLIDSSGHLDAARIWQQYFEANFDLLIDGLESYRKTAADPSDQDRILIYQYLGVIYAKDPETRKKGESFLYQWISLNPDAEIEGLFVSDVVHELFLKQKQDYAKVHAGPHRNGANPGEKPVESDGNGNREHRSSAKSNSIFARHWVAWTAGAAAAGTLVAFTLLSASDDSPDAAPETGKDQLIFVTPGGK